MTTMLPKGVHLDVTPSQQFKTLQIMVDFGVPATPKAITTRALQSYLQAVSSAAYPAQQAVAAAVIALYGAEYSTDVLRIGGNHHLRFTLTFPAPEYVAEDATLMTAACRFLGEMIFAPYAGDDPTIFATEKQNLQADLAAIQENKSRYAVQQLNQRLATGPFCPADGDATLLAGLTPADVARSHQAMLAEDHVTIAVLGDCDPEIIREQVANWAWPANRTPVAIQTTRQHCDQLPAVPVAATLSLPHMQQATLALGYQLCWRADHDERYAALVLNAVFGGGPLSRLFTDVREKASLAYSIHSYWQPERSRITVVAGVAPAQVAAATAKIQEQLQVLATAYVDEALLAAVKEQLVTSYQSAEDSPLDALRLRVTTAIHDRVYALPDWCQRIQAVTAADVQALAKRVQFMGSVVLAPEKETTCKN